MAHVVHSPTASFDRNQTEEISAGAIPKTRRYQDNKKTEENENLFLFNEMPGVPFEPVGEETALKKEQTNTKRRATAVIKEIDLARKSKSGHENPEDLEWALEKAFRLQAELMQYQNLCKDPQRSSHLFDIEGAIFRARSCLERWKEERREKTGVPPVTINQCNQDFTAESNSSSNNQLHPSDLAALTKLALKPPHVPSFNPDNEALPWYQFWSKYQNAIGTQSCIQKSDKLSYLLGLLEGKAKSAVAGFEEKEENYDLIVQKLKKRFDDSEGRKDELLDRLVSFPSLDGLNYDELQEKSDFILNTFHELRRLGEGSDFSELAVNRIEKIIPRDWRYRWFAKKRNSPISLTIDDLINQIEEELELKKQVLIKPKKNQCHSSKSTENQASTSTPNQSRKSVNLPRRALTSSLVVNRNVPSSRPLRSFEPERKINRNYPEENSFVRPKCAACCGSLHSLTGCKKFLDMNQPNRKDLIQRSNLCINCLGPHAFSACRSRFVCRTCGEKHHTLLCPPQPQRNVSCAVSLPATGGAESPSLQVTHQPSNIYVMTAVCKAIGHHETRSVRVFFDSGSDTSFIRTDTALELNLPVVETGYFACLGVQGRPEPCKYFERVACTLESLSQPVQVHVPLWCMDNLCAPLKPRQPPDHPAFKDLFFADDFSPGRVDIIVGTDQMYHFLGHTHIQLAPTLRAYETVLGWVVHGKGAEDLPQLTHHLSTISVCKADIQNLWDLETIGITTEPEISHCLPKPRWDPVERKVEVDLLWRNEKRPISNFSAAVTRVNKMTEKLTTDQKILYDEFIKTKTDEGVISTSPKEWRPYQEQFFLPHRAIFQDQVLYFHRLPFGLICSPALLHASLDFLLSKCPDPDLETILRNGLYFDDLAIGFKSTHEAKLCSEKIQKHFDHEGGMTLHKIRISGEDVPPAKLLGLTWDTKSDCLYIQVPTLCFPKNKRDLLSLFSRVWDPLGIVSPWILNVKFIFQKTWVLNLNWDDLLPEEIADNLKTWINEAVYLQEISFPRICCISPAGLECFVDASSQACCAVIYLLNEKGERQLLTAKTRLAPVSQTLSIPRLELIAALIGVRLTKFVLDSFQTLNFRIIVRFFTDSQDVLYWLQEKKPLKLFVHNRVREILTLTSLDQWHYVETKQNPADIGTRGFSLTHLATSDLWWHGPSQPISTKPFFNPVPSVEATCEEKKEQKQQNNKAKTVLPATLSSEDPLKLFDLEAISSFSAVVFRTAWIFRFISNCRNLKGENQNEEYDHKQLKSSKKTQKVKPLTIDEIEKAKMFWIKEEQNSFFDLEVISKGRIPKRLKQYRPYVKDDCLYSSPRTGEPPVLILPPESRLTYLIILDAHLKMFHQGAAATSSLLHSEYLVSRSTIKKALHQCRPCRRFRAIHLQGPEGPLPKTRCEFTRCFARTGVDFFGPLFIEEKKHYCLIFTCFSSRAIHLELVESQSAEDTTRAFRRFFALRGKPEEILSDNARTFKLLAKTIDSSVRWKTIPERSPWWGGFYERLVGIVKQSMKIALKGKRMSAKSLELWLYELSYFLNIRPLTKFRDEVLSPASFLYGVPSTVSLMKPGILGSPIEHWRVRKAAMLEVHRRFYREYLNALRQWRNPNKQIRLPSAGDVVIIHDNGPRQFWHLGIIEKLIKGNDGNYRAAFVRTRGITTRRALERLYLVEAADSSFTHDVTEAVFKPNDDQIHCDDFIPEEEETNELENFQPYQKSTRHGRQIKLPSRFQD